MNIQRAKYLRSENSPFFTVQTAKLKYAKNLSETHFDVQSVQLFQTNIKRFIKQIKVSIKIEFADDSQT